MLKLFLSILGCSILCITNCKTLTEYYPTLPDLWTAETIEPGAPGSGYGVESYKFVESPTGDNPSALWSNYTDCERLIYIASNSNAKRYLLGCDSVNCCYEEQDGNQVQFQIPNVHYSNPKKKVDVYHDIVNITYFNEEMQADEWSWSWNINDKLRQDWKAYTIYCKNCVNDVILLQWKSKALDSEWFTISFKNYKGFDISTPEGEKFAQSFQIPPECQKNNLLKCPSGLHDKYFLNKINYNKEREQGQQQSECDVVKYLKNAGFPSHTIGTMVCISKYESSWNCGATNKNVDGSTDYGLFEINSYYWCSGDSTSKYNECGTSCSSLMDCQKNANCAYKVYKEQGFNAWYGYQYHKKECDSYPIPSCLNEEYIIQSSCNPVDNVDLDMYSGRWYQIYKNHFDMLFQGEGTCAVADYTITRKNISVVNSQIDKNGKIDQITGYAFYQNGDSGGKLSVSLSGIPNPMPYWIIKLGPVVNNQYEYSIISDDRQISLFVLARDVDVFYKKYNTQVKKSLQELGFTNNINKPIVMSQDNCDYSKFSISTSQYDNYQGSSDCGVCGTAYQTCCIGFGAKGYPCDCHLQYGTGQAGSNCGDCGTAYAACCIGYAADGYPCECDVL